MKADTVEKRGMSAEDGGDMRRQKNKKHTTFGKLWCLD